MDHELLDPSALRALHELAVPGEPDPATEVAQTFLDVTPERLARLRQAALEVDLDAVRRIAHLVRGSCGTIGAVAMHALAAEVESSVDAASAQQFVAQLEDAFARTRPLLEVRP